MDLMETECEVRWTQLALDHVHRSFKISGVEPLSSAGSLHWYHHHQQQQH